MLARVGLEVFAEQKYMIPAEKDVIMLGLYKMKDGSYVVGGDTLEGVKKWEEVLPEILAAINEGVMCCNISKFQGMAIDGGKKG